MGHGDVQEFDWSHLLVEPRSYDKWHDIVKFLLQVHDSIVPEVAYKDERYIEEIVKDMGVIVPYADPLLIPMSYSQSRLSWGDCK